ncbi:MAG: acyloxyacyl hydrolase [Bacteroidetes bacterium]|nr:acyloxyacyl hydrolase [Bacteroidota bacterium]
MNAQNTQPKASKIIQAKIELSPEYVWHSNIGNEINTTSFNVFFMTHYLNNPQFEIYFGLTATRAKGKIQDWNTQNPSIIYHESSAEGFGPIVHFQQIIFEMNRVTLFAAPSVGIIFYNKNFPYGGDIYNFMWRMGILFEYRINKNYSINIGCKWMHVSNGQGSGANNPFYEGKGLSVALTKQLNFKR